LRHAVPDKQLRLYYQIQLDSDLRPLGAEALMRRLAVTNFVDNSGTPMNIPS
jgi:hypothetical protein